MAGVYGGNDVADGADGADDDVALLMRDGPATGGMGVDCCFVARGGMRSAGGESSEGGPGDGTIWEVRSAAWLLLKRALMAWANASCAWSFDEL